MNQKSIQKLNAILVEAALDEHHARVALQEAQKADLPLEGVVAVHQKAHGEYRVAAANLAAARSKLRS